MLEIKFRPHHFLCTLCFQGKGYSPAFITNYQEIVEQLKTNPDSKITVVKDTDSICAPCPNRQGALCTSEEKISRLDQAHSAALGIRPGETLTWAAAKQQIATQLTLPKFHEMCNTCSWKDLGICEQVLTDYLTKS